MVTKLVLLSRAPASRRNVNIHLSISLSTPTSVFTRMAGPYSCSIKARTADHSGHPGRVSNWSQSAGPEGRMPIVQHLYSPSEKLVSATPCNHTAKEDSHGSLAQRIHDHRGHEEGVCQLPVCADGAERLEGWCQRARAHLRRRRRGSRGSWVLMRCGLVVS